MGILLVRWHGRLRLHVGCEPPPPLEAQTWVFLWSLFLVGHLCHWLSFLVGGGTVQVALHGDVLSEVFLVILHGDILSEILITVLENGFLLDVVEFVTLHGNIFGEIHTLHNSGSVEPIWACQGEI